MKKVFILLVFSAFVFLSASWAFAQTGQEEVQLPALVLTILTVIAPPVWQFVVKKVRQEQIRFIILIGLCVVTGVATMWYNKEAFTFDLPFIYALFFWSSASYKLVWKILFNSVLPALKGVPTRSL
jgi:hypothetical protein